jgi:hypothetical protein
MLTTRYPKIMKKLILHSLITAMVFGGALTVFAETGSVQVNASASARANASTTPGPIKAMIEAKKELQTETKDKIAELRNNIASSTQEKRDDRKEIIKLRIENRFGKMFLRYQATIDRETIIMNRINTRIEKIKADGSNASTTEAVRFTAEAKIHIGEAQTALDLLKTTAYNDSQIASST